MTKNAQAKPLSRRTKWTVLGLVLLAVGSCTGLQFHAQNHDLGTLDQATKALRAALENNSTIPSEFLEPDYRAAPDMTKIESALRPVTGSHMRRTPTQEAGAVTYDAGLNPQGEADILQSYWRVTTEWNGARKPYGIYWRIRRMCWLRPALTQATQAYLQGKPGADEVQTLSVSAENGMVGEIRARQSWQGQTHAVEFRALGADQPCLFEVKTTTPEETNPSAH